MVSVITRALKMLAVVLVLVSAFLLMPAVFAHGQDPCLMTLQLPVELQAAGATVDIRWGPSGLVHGDQFDVTEGGNVQWRLRVSGFTSSWKIVTGICDGQLIVTAADYCLMFIDIPDDLALAGATVDIRYDSPNGQYTDNESVYLPMGNDIQWRLSVSGFTSDYKSKTVDCTPLKVTAPDYCLMMIDIPDSLAAAGATVDIRYDSPNRQYTDNESVYLPMGNDIQWRLSVSGFTSDYKSKTVDCTPLKVTAPDYCLMMIDIPDSLAAAGATVDIRYDSPNRQYTNDESVYLPMGNDIQWRLRAGSYTSDYKNKTIDCTELIVVDVTITKESDTAISKIGDNITYTITIENDGAFDLITDNITDSLFGDITSSFSNPLIVGGTDTVNFIHTVQPSDTDPLINAVTAHYHIDGLLIDIPFPGNCSVDIVHPSISVSKESDTAISKVGDNITYTITIENTGDVDLVVDNITDSLLGEITGSFLNPLPEGVTDVVNVVYTVKSGDPNPLVNTVTAHYHVDGLSNDISATDNCSVDLVHPSLSVTKAADTTISKLGDTITYTITIENTGDVDLVADNITDSLLGDITPSFLNFLPEGVTDIVNIDYTVQSGDLDPLVNTVTAHYRVDGLLNDISATDNCSVDLVQPLISVIMESGTTTSKVGDTITYTITIQNTGDVDLLTDSITDTLLGDLTGSFLNPLPGGVTDVVNVVYIVKSGNLDPLVNMVTAHYHVDGLPNDISASGNCFVDLLQPSMSVTQEPDTILSSTDNAKNSLQEARFTPSKIEISYDQVKSNEMLDISISIANTGDKQGSYFVPLIINGYMEQGVLVYVNPNSIQRVIFKVTKSEPGTYDVSIASKHAKFTVVQSEEMADVPSEDSDEITQPSHKPLPVSAIVAISILGIIIAGGFIVIFKSIK